MRRSIDDQLIATQTSHRDNATVANCPCRSLQRVIAISDSAAPVVGVSPIVGGAPVKGPAAQLLRAVGCEVSARGVAGLYASLLDGFVIDHRDSAQVDEIRALGLACRAVDSMMVTPEVARSLAQATLELVSAQ